MEGKYFADERDTPFEHACFIRATAYQRWCGNRPSDRVTVSVTFEPTGRSQDLVSGSCDEEWVLYDGNCYFHNHQKLSWNNANRECNDMQSSLASIHSKEENEFIHYLTQGLATWIGIVDLNDHPKLPPDHRWTDNTPVNYRNWNGTLDSSDPGSAWYNKPSDQLSPSVCKKPAKDRRSRIVTAGTQTEHVANKVSQEVSMPTDPSKTFCDITPYRKSHCWSSPKSPLTTLT